MLRSPLDQLHSVHPEISTRLQTLSKQLEHLSSVPRESQAAALGSLDPEQIAQNHRRLATEYIDLLSRIRTLPGFEDFLKPMKASGLLRASRNGPIVVITCHEKHCDALLINPGRDNVDHVPLPHFTAEDARAGRLKMNRAGLRERGFKVRQGQTRTQVVGGVLATLWHGVVNPILDYLGYIKNHESDNLPHITWCPTGAMSFLPLHAAGDYDQQLGSRVFDYVVSSYTPTLTALLASAPSSLSPDSRILAIGQPATPGHSPLPGTTRELSNVRTRVAATAQFTQLVHDQATTSAVLDAMEQHDWVHLACHAHQNVTDPTKSGFFLYDGILEVAAINRQSFKNKGLAFLSACQTATGDERLPDEAVHLASCMLMTGYPSVIATTWSVVDEDAPFVADKVYDQLMKEGKVGNGEAGRALHNAVAELRKKVGEKAFDRWAPYIHIGS